MTVKYVGMRKSQFLALLLIVLILGAVWWLPGQGPSSGRATIYAGLIENLPVDASNGSLAVITDGTKLSDTRSGGSTFEVLGIFDGASKTWNSVRTIPATGSVHSGSGATANTSGTPIAIAGTFNPSGLEVLFDNPQDGRLRYIGLRTRTFACSADYSFTSSSNNRIISFMVAKNGTVVTDAEITHKIGAGADVVSMSTGCIVSLAVNDYLEVTIDSDSGNPTLTTQHLSLIAWVVD